MAKVVSTKKKLVVVESPGKIKKISSILGTDYIVKASFGHIMDLPQSGLGIDVDKDFEPTYAVIPKKKDTVADLKRIAKDVDEVFLCSDPDREGEFISESVRRLIDHKGLRFHRVTFDAITKIEVLKGFAAPRVIDQNLVEAQQARRILDRLTGFKISPLLWRREKDKDEKSRSAGRVQSVGLQMIVDRQKEIDIFVPTKYWTVEATLSDGTEEFVVTLFRNNGKILEKLSIDSQDKADKVVAFLDKQDFVVESVDIGQEKKNPPAPFTTSTLQQTCSGAFNWSSKQTMAVAQKLYEGGHQTYMRTDSVSITPEAVTALRALIPQITAKKYLPATPNTYQSKGKTQEAHEAVRVTNLTDDLPQVLMAVSVPDEKKLLELIWRRTIASQMMPAIYDKIEVAVKAGYMGLKATGQTQAFDGYLKIWTYSDTKELTLPKLKVGQKLTKVSVVATQHETKPPARYTNASLVKELEANGVGRPSTYAAIIDTLINRGYVTMDGKAFVPTPKGIEVSDFLKEYFSNIINVGFTSQMEESLDKVAEGTKTRVELLSAFYKELKNTIDEVRAKVMVNEASKEVCPSCSSPMFIKLNRKDKERFLACSNKDCKRTFDMDKDGKPVEKKVEKLGKPCPECGGDLVKKSGPRGFFYGCVNYKDKGCRVTADMTGEVRLPNKVVNTGRKCKKCKKGEMIERANRSTGDKFLGCSAYPKCKNVESLKEKDE
jgi:DNA topoisomerase-1